MGFLHLILEPPITILFVLNSFLHTRTHINALTDTHCIELRKMPYTFSDCANHWGLRAKLLLLTVDCCVLVCTVAIEL